MNINNLPIEILEIVLIILDEKWHFILKNVCRKWHHIILSWRIRNDKPLTCLTTIDVAVKTISLLRWSLFKLLYQ